MKKQMLQFKKIAVKFAFGMLLIFAAGIFQIKAQTVATPMKGGNDVVPSEFISPTKFSVTKTVDPSITFDEMTPYFTELYIVNPADNEVNTVLVIDETDASNNIVKRKFDFTAVPSGIYYAKGLLTGTLVYYQINLLN